jgi:hypothetical protein
MDANERQAANACERSVMLVNGDRRLFRTMKAKADRHRTRGARELAAWWVGSADDAGLASWEQALAIGASRDSVTRGFIDSEEAHRRAVDGFCPAWLHRAGEAKGEQFWWRSLRTGQSPKAVAVGFLASEEYSVNALPHVGP